MVNVAGPPPAAMGTDSGLTVKVHGVPLAAA
jgi:hypothetical protein